MLSVGTPAVERDHDAGSWSGMGCRGVRSARPPCDSVELVWSTTEPTVAAAPSMAPEAFAKELNELVGQAAGGLRRAETRRTMRRFVTGLTARLPTKNCRTVAKHLEHRDSHILQHFLGRASWDDAGVAADLLGFARDRLGRAGGNPGPGRDREREGGHPTIGVQRQYTGTAGRTENSQVAVHLGYRAELGAHPGRPQAVPAPQLGRRPLPPRRGGGSPPTWSSPPRGTLAVAMPGRFLTVDGTAEWLTGDKAYGDCPQLHEFTESRELDYVLAIGCNRNLTTAAGHTARADELVGGLSKGRWHAMSAEDGTKGPRTHDWGVDRVGRRPRIRSQAPLVALPPQPFHRGTRLLPILLHPPATPRHPSQRSPDAAGRSRSTSSTPRPLVSLHEHQVRTWGRPGAAGPCFCMLDLAVLTVIAAHAAADVGIVAPTRNEIHNLIVALTHAACEPQHAPAWPTWRRRHQCEARQSHYQRRTPPSTMIMIYRWSTSWRLLRGLARARGGGAARRACSGAPRRFRGADRPPRSPRLRR